MLPEFVIACDLGQVNDPTAICVVERRLLATGRTENAVNFAAFWAGGDGSPPVLRVPQVAYRHDVTHLERLPLGTPYTAVPDRVRTIEERVRQRWQALVWQATARLPALDEAPIALVVDQTGVGRPVLDILREHGLAVTGITIHGGDTVVRVAADEWRVPKRVLVGQVQAAMQTKRLRAAASLPDWPALKTELTNFKAKISLSGHDSYGAGGGAEDWRGGGAHDDLTLAVAMAVWWGES